MSAIIVLIIRILMVLSIYSFLALALLTLWRELKKTSERQATLAHPAITIHIEGKAKRQFLQPEILIGRGLENDIQLTDETISLQHARIYHLNENWMVEDSQSTNGTFLNGESIHSPTVLVDQDRIDIGSKTLEVNISGNTPPA